MKMSYFQEISFIYPDGNAVSEKENVAHGTGSLTR